MSENSESKENKKRRFDEGQYTVLLNCSYERDMTEWKEWRKANKIYTPKRQKSQISCGKIKIGTHYMFWSLPIVLLAERM